MTDDERPNVPVRSTVTSFRLLQELQDRGGASQSELAASLDVAKSTVYNHLATLEDLEYVVRDGDHYRLGLRCLDHGGHARVQQDGYGLVREKARDVADETGELCQYLVEEHGQGVFIVRESGSQAVRTGSRVGKRVYLHQATAGKALLSQLPEERVREIVDRHGLSPKTHQTITTTEDLLAQLRTIRERGYAFDRDEHIEGLYGLGVPLEIDGELLGAFSIAGPSNRLQDSETEAEMAQLLLGVTNEIQLNLAFS